MTDKPQNLKNHVRRQPIYHFVLIPVLLTNGIIAAVWLVRVPGWRSALGLVMALALLVLAFLVRLNPLKVQDRVIRLEERMRLTELLPDPLRRRIPELTEKQLTALRFASDAEIPALVQKTLLENLNAGEIKKAIANWRADVWRV